MFYEINDLLNLSDNLFFKKLQRLLGASLYTLAQTDITYLTDFSVPKMDD